MFKIGKLFHLTHVVSDLAAAYGGSLRLDTSPLGGLRAELRLPAA